MNAVEKREQTSAAVRAWQAQASWTRARDVLISLYLVFLFHDIFIRLLGSEFLPAVIGVRLPPLPWRDAIVLLLLVIGLWRMYADVSWRRRFRAPHVWWQVAFLLLAAAFLSLHATTFAQMNVAKGLLYPMIMFGAGILSGYDWRKARDTIVVLALVNIAAALIIAVFFLGEYRLWIAAYRTVFGESSALSFGKYEQIFLLPMPFLLERTNLAVLYIISSAIALHELLWNSIQKRQRFYFAALCVASIFMVLGTFSRGGIVTMFLVLLGLFAVWSMQRAQSRGRSAAYGLLALVPVLLVMAFIALTTVTAVRLAYGIDMLDPSNLISKGREGRITIWTRVVDDINRQHGWLTGIKPSFRIARASIVFGAKGGDAWSEWSYYTVDNAYLYLVMQGGLPALAGMLAFLGLAAWQFQRHRCYLSLMLLVCSCLVWWMLATNPILVSLALLLGGGQLGNQMLEEPRDHPAARAPAGALPVST